MMESLSRMDARSRLRTSRLCNFPESDRKSIIETEWDLFKEIDCKPGEVFCAIHNENCIQAGQLAYEPRNYDGSFWPAGDGDVTIYKGTARELLRQAVRIRRSAFAGSYNQYRFRVYKTLRDFARQTW